MSWLTALTSTTNLTFALGVVSLAAFGQRPGLVAACIVPDLGRFSGLGLSIVRDLVESFGGQCHCRTYRLTGCLCRFAC